MQPHTATPGGVIPSEGTNDNFDALADGSGMTDDNSLRLHRYEASPGGFSPNTSGLIWSLTSGLTGAMTAGILYLVSSGLMRRVSVAQITSKVFTASKDTWISVNVDGTVDYNALANGTARPTPTAGYTHIGLVVTDGSTITAIISFVQRSSSEGGTEIARVANLTTRTNLTIENLPTGYKYLKIVGCGVAAGGTIDSTFRFNNDSGTTYAHRYSANHAAETAAVSQTSIPIESGATDSGQMVTLEMLITQITTKEKTYEWVAISQDAAGGATNVVVIRGYGKWANTAALISRLDWLSSNFGAGSELIVYGHN